MRMNALILLAMVLTAVGVGLVWYFRFLPLYDLPVWMYEIHILRELPQSAGTFSKYFIFNPIPVPNLGLVASLWLFSQAVSLECAAKIYLSLCIIAFPWSFWYGIRAIAGRDTPFAYLGFPYLLNLFVFVGQAYLLGLIAFLLCVGYFVPRLETMNRIRWALLFVCVLLCYFIHAIAWFLLLIVLFGVIVNAVPNRRLLLKRLIMVEVPAIALLVWYALALSEKKDMYAAWNFYSVAQNVLKPLGLVVKSYGLSSPWPVTLINVGWFAFLGVAFLRQWRIAGLRAITRSPFFLPAAICFILAVALGTETLGIMQPGARFVLPGLFLAALTLGNVPLWKWWSGGLLLLSAVVCLYNFSFFGAIDERARELLADIDSAFVAFEPLYVLPLDWPAGSGLMDVGSASVNPLPFVPYYRRMADSSIAWIHGTALLRLRPEWKVYQPQIKGPTRREFAQSVKEHLKDLEFFNSFLVVGNNDESRYVAGLLKQKGFEERQVRPLWTLLVRSGLRKKEGGKVGSYSLEQFHEHASSEEGRLGRNWSHSPTLVIGSPTSLDGLPVPHAP